MAETSTIEWTDATWNPIAGCSLASAGCTNCYAMGMARRHELMSAALGRVSPYASLTRVVNGKAVWTGDLRLVEDAITLPLRWKKPKRIFVNSMSDLFHDSVPDEWIDRVFAVMALAPHHTFQVLTKRGARMRAYMAHPRVRNRISAVEGGFDPDPSYSHVDGPWPLPNVWLGVSAEDQRRADERVPDLLATPAAVRFVSAEPLLGPLDLRRIEAKATGKLIDGDFVYPKRVDALTGWAGHHASPTLFHPNSHRLPALDWIIVGGESGPGARPMHPDWARSLRDQCAAASVPFHFKQWGEFVDLLHCERWNEMSDAARSRQQFLHGSAMIQVGKKAAGRLLDNVEHNGMPTAP